MVKHLLLIASLSMAVSARADDPPDAYRAHYPPHYFFGFNAPPAPSAQGRFGFDSGEDRGFGGQYLREENYEHSHGLNGAQAECSDPPRARARPRTTEIPQTARRLSFRHGRPRPSLILVLLAFVKWIQARTTRSRIDACASHTPRDSFPGGWWVKWTVHVFAGIARNLCQAR